MATFLLVHGAFHGSWCWERLIPLLVTSGHRVAAIDLPAPSDDGSRSPQQWLDPWAEAVLDQLRAYEAPAVLVGHSRAGIVISEVAERAPDRVARLVFVAAMLVRDGETMAAARARLGEKPGGPLQLRREGDVLHADPAAAAALIYPAAPTADRARAVAALKPEPLAGFQIAPRLTDARFGRVPRAYVECADDRIFDLALQRRMREDMPCSPVITLEADHAPYYSDPEGLAKALDAIAADARDANGGSRNAAVA